MSQMPQAEVDRFFELHLPYRLRILMRYCEGQFQSPVAFSDSCFIASVVTGRLLLQFLGINVRNNRDALRNDPSTGYRGPGSDVRLSDLGATGLTIEDLSPEDHALFIPYLRMANKAAAHLTAEMDHDHTIAIRAAHRILELVKKHAYEATGRTSPVFEEIESRHYPYLPPEAR